MEVPCLGMGGSVVVDLISELQQEEGRSFQLTFENLFTSLKLVDCLSKIKSSACTGTIRANRNENCPLKSMKEMETSKRRNFDYATDVKSGLTVVHWNGNPASNKVAVAPP